MPLSATFHFFFPFHFKKKYHTYLSLNPYSYPSPFYTSHLLYSFNQQCKSATIFVILLLLLNITKY